MDPVRPAIEGTTYRRLRFGKLADLSLLDLRSFRSQQASTASGTVDDPNRTIAGQAPTRLAEGRTEGVRHHLAAGRQLGDDRAVRHRLAHRRPAQAARQAAGPAAGRHRCQHRPSRDGYTDDRRELLAHLRSNAIGNTVFLTGDIHMSWANDVPVDAGTYPLSASAATEFRSITSVTSDNLDDIVKVPEGTVSALAAPLIQIANRHVHWVNTATGYGVLDITADRAQIDYYVLSDRTDANATSSWARSYRTRTGTQKVERTYDPV